MMSQTDVPLYWLMSGTTPIGPYSVEEILSQIQSGACTWTTKASLVGSQTWKPLNQLLPLAPVAQLAPADATVSKPMDALFQAKTVLYSHWRKIILFGFGGWFLYWLVSSAFSGPSLTPQQVCEIFLSAKTAAEAKRYATPNLYAAIDSLASHLDSGSDDGTQEITGIEPVPQQSGGGYYVGCRFHIREPNNALVIESVFHVVEQSGWKIQDWYILAANGQSIDPPVSFAREYEYFRDPQHPSVAGRQSIDAKKQAKSWYSDRTVTRGIGAFLHTSGLGKWIVGLIGVIVVGCYQPVQERTSSTQQVSRA